MGDAAPEVGGEEPAGSGSPPFVEVVARFLGNIRGLGHLQGAELDAALHKRRFELLPPRAEKGVPPKDAAAAGGGRLPAYWAIPTLQELHTALAEELVPQGHQCVAHVLRPEHVPWPAPAKAAPAPRRCEDGDAKLPTPASPKTPLSPSGATDRHGHSHSPTSPPLQAAGPDPEKGGRAHGRPQSPSPQQRRLHEASKELDERKQDIAYSLLWLRKQRAAKEATEQDASVAVLDVTVRGQKLTTTLRGRPARADPQDPKGDLDQDRSNPARQERMRMERAVQLEEYREQKIGDRIKNLEAMRANELQKRDMLTKREDKRKKRYQELQEQLTQFSVEKSQQEEEEAQKKKERQEKEKAAIEKVKQRNELQKERINGWWTKRCEQEANGEDLHVKRRAEEEAARKDKIRQMELRREERKTEKQKAVERSMKQLQSAIAERPPMMPKQHDIRPPPAAALLGVADSSTEAGGPSQAKASSRPKPPKSAACEAKYISNSYGLSAKEQEGVNKALNSCVRGVGRMGQYDTD